MSLRRLAQVALSRPGAEIPCGEHEGRVGGFARAAAPCSAWRLKKKLRLREARIAVVDPRPWIGKRSLRSGSPAE